PQHRETPLEAPEMAPMLAALRVILSRHEPYGAVALDRHLDIVMASPSYAAVINASLPATPGGGPAPIEPLTLTRAPRPNMLRLLCHPAGYRSALVNWAEVTRAVLTRVEREVARQGRAATRHRALLEECLAYPDVAALRREAPLDAGPAPLVIPVE